MAELNTLTLGNNAVELNSTALLSDGNLLSYHRFEGNSLDETANNNDGTDTSITYGSSYGKFTQGALFNGTSSKIALTNEITSSTGTVCFWINTTASSDRTIYSQSKTSGGDTDRAHINLASGKINFLVQQSSGVVLNVSTVSTFNDGAWHFVAVVVGASSNKIYVDGGQQSVTYTTGSASTSKWFGTVSANTDTKDIGVLNINGTNYNWFSGSLDDLAFFSDELTEAEIKSLGDLTRKAYYRLNNAVALDATSIPTTNLKAYYKFDSGALTTDSSGNSRTLTAIGTPTETTGKINGAVALASASSQAYSVTDHADFKPTGSFTVGAWIKSSSTDNKIFASFSYPGSRFAGFYFEISASGKLNFTSGNNTGNTGGTHYQSSVSSKSINDNTWHHVVGTWDGSTLKTYVDGVADGSTAWSNAPSYDATNYVRVGCQSNSGTNLGFLTGSLDELFINNGTALTASQIAEIYALGYDSSGNGNNGTNTAVTETTGKYFGGGDFVPANDSKLAIPYSNIGTSITHSAWFKTDITTEQSIIAFMNTWLRINRTSQGTIAYSPNQDTTIVTASTTINTGTWYHIAVTQTSTSYVIYLNGASVGSGTTVAVSTTNGTINAIGSHGGTVEFDGVLDDVAIFSRALTAGEVLELYTDGSPSPSLSPSASPSASQSPSSSASSSVSSSPSVSISASPSSSQSPSSSISASPSVSVSASESSSFSRSGSPSSSVSPSSSFSASPSPTPSASPSRSESASQSASPSASPSSSQSPSSSMSATPSPSPSASISQSPSSSVSASPSPAQYQDMYSDSGNTYIDKYRNWT